MYKVSRCAHDGIVITNNVLLSRGKGRAMDWPPLPERQDALASWGLMGEDLASQGLNTLVARRQKPLSDLQDASVAVSDHQP